MQRFVDATTELADEAARLAVTNLPAGHDADVARRAAAHAHEAAESVRTLAASGTATFEEVMVSATWAMTSAAVAVAQGNLAVGMHRVAVE